MNKKNKKAHSALLPGEFYCGKCNEYMKNKMKHKGAVHCVNCEKRGVEARKNYVDKPVEKAKVEVLNARAIRQRAADLMLEIEYKRINGNHLADYL